MGKTLKKSSTSYRHGNLREAILITSLQIIEKEGVENLSIRQVAKKAGVTHQAPYRHFKDREALLAALVQDGAEKLYQQMQDSLASAKEPMTKLQKLAEGYFKWACEHPDHFRLVVGHHVPDFESSEGLQSSANSILQLILTVVAENQDANNIRQGDTRSYARQFWATTHGVSVLFINQQFKPLGRDFRSGLALINEVVSSLVNGLRPR